MTSSLIGRKTQPVRNQLPSQKELLVLELLSTNGDLYGLQLVSLSDGALKRGTIYVTLGRMEDKGLVKSILDDDASSHAGLPRPRYQITAQGARALKACSLALAALHPVRSER